MFSIVNQGLIPLKMWCRNTNKDSFYPSKQLSPDQSVCQTGLAKCRFAAELKSAAPRVQGVENRQALTWWGLGATGLCPEKRYHHCVSPPMHPGKYSDNLLPQSLQRSLHICALPDPTAKECYWHPALLEALPCLPEGLWKCIRGGAVALAQILISGSLPSAP